MTTDSLATYIYNTTFNKLIVFCEFRPALYSCSINVTYSLWYYNLKLVIIPWSISCYTDVVFGGSYKIRIFERPYILLTNCTLSSWLEKLSINSRTFLLLLCILLLSYCKYFSYISPVIYLDLLNRYIIRRFLRLILLKACSFSDFLISSKLLTTINITS